LVAKAVAEKYQKNVHTINLSRSGAKIADVLNRQLPAYQALGITAPHIVTIEIGANDVTTFDPVKFETEMKRLMGKLPPQTVISDIPSFQGSRLAKYEAQVDQANKIMSRLAKKYAFELAGLHQNISANHGLRTFAADFFHPSDYGYKTNWAPVFLERILENNPPDQKRSD